MKNVSLPWPLNTTESWLIILAFAWGIAAKFGVLPASVGGGEAGTLGPAVLLIAAVARILGKTGAAGQTPFKPLVLALLLGLTLVAPAVAQTIPPVSDNVPWGHHTRFGWGIETGFVSYQSDPVATEMGFLTSPFLFWSAGPKATIAVQHFEDWTNSRYKGQLGLRWNLVSAEPQNDVRLTFGINGIVYGGSGYTYLTGVNPKASDRLGWGFDIGGGVHLVGILGMKLRAGYDMQNQELDGRVTFVATDTF